jgi:hypothetical protein
VRIRILLSILATADAPCGERGSFLMIEALSLRSHPQTQRRAQEVVNHCMAVFLERLRRFCPILETRLRCEQPVRLAADARKEKEATVIYPQARVTLIHSTRSFARTPFNAGAASPRQALQPYQNTGWP